MLPRSILKCLPTSRAWLRTLYSILSQALEIGRHFKSTVVVTNHLPTNGKDTRRILNKAHTITYVPRSAGGRIRYLLENYMGLGKKQMQYF